jgi:hypothetical protein
MGSFTGSFLTGIVTRASSSFNHGSIHAIPLFLDTKNNRSSTQVISRTFSDSSIPRHISTAQAINNTSLKGVDTKQHKRSLESVFCYDKEVPEEIIEKPVGLLSLSERKIDNNPRCEECEAKGVVLCDTCAGSGLYVDSILESQGVIVKVRCLGCGGTGNIMCSECGGRGHL